MPRATRFVAVLLCCSLSPLSLLAQGAGAMLNSAGQVTVNGRSAANSTAIFPGDRIQVGPNSSATISAQGMSAQIAADSAVTWQQQAVEFQNGSLTMSAQAPWQVRIGTTSISLGPDMAKVEIVQREDVALIKLVQGSATLNENGQITAMKIGFTVARPNPIAPVSASAPAATGAHGSHIGIIALVAGGGAAAGIGLGLRGHGSQTPVSPSAP